MERASRSTLAACTQPWCMLRESMFDSEFASALIVRLLAGEDLSGVVPPERRIALRDPCVGCANGVLHGRRPLVTLEQLTRLAAAGHWSSWRSRRVRHRERHREH